MATYLSTELDSAAISERLRTLREEKGLTQQQIADMCGLKNKTSIKSFEKGQVPTVHILVKLCEIYGRSLNELLYGTEERSVAAGTGDAPALGLYRVFVQLHEVDQKLLTKAIELLGGSERRAKEDLRHSVNLVLRAYGYA